MLATCLTEIESLNNERPLILISDDVITSYWAEAIQIFNISLLQIMSATFVQNGNLYKIAEYLPLLRDREKSRT